MAAMITLADPSKAWATGLSGLRSKLAIWAWDRPARTLRAALRPGQDVGVTDVGERDRLGLAGAVDLGGHVGCAGSRYGATRA